MIFVIKQFNSEEIKERLLASHVIRIIFLLHTFCKYVYHYYVDNNVYLAVSATLRYERILCGMKYRVCNIIKNINNNIANSTAAGDTNLLTSFLMTQNARNLKKEFLAYGKQNAVRLKYPKKDDRDDRQGDLLVLKPHISAKEKGVLFIQYNDAFLKLAAIFDLKKLSERYKFVLEPSSWGYRDSAFFLFLGLGTDVIIEAQHEEDYDYIKKLGYNLCPLRLGAGDWVDPQIFKGDVSCPKVYDIVMVASWLRLKRHHLLFQSVREIKDKVNKIALIGYPIGGRTVDDIKKEAISYGILDKLVFFERISPEEVSSIIRQSKIGVMLSKREGANKGIYECFFSDVPVILTSENIGVNRSQINEFTGNIATDSELSEKIAFMIQNLNKFSPCIWASQHTGCVNSHHKLNSMLKTLALGSGEEWSKDIYPKKNATNALYVNKSDRLDAEGEFVHLTRFLLK